MAYNPNAPADDEFLADFPAEQREQHRALIEDRIVDADSVRGLVPGNTSGNVAVNNGTVCANLNADKLDGHDATYFSADGHVHAAATTSSDGFMSNTDKSKLDGVTAGAEPNQNAFANVKVGSTTIQADAKQDTLELTAGTNITLTPDQTNDKVTIAAPNVLPLAGGTMTGALTIDQNNNNPLTLKTTASYNDIQVTDGTNRIGTLRFQKDTTNSLNKLFLGVIPYGNNNAPSGIEISRNSSGTVTATAPTPAAGDNSTKIATTAFVHNYLPLSGGTLTGSIASSATDLLLYKTNATGRAIMRGGTTYNDGSSLYLMGKSHSNGAGFELTNNDGTNSASLVGKAGGTLTWKGKPVIVGNWGITEYSGVSVNANSHKLVATLSNEPFLYSVFVSGTGSAACSAIIFNNKNLYIRNNSSSNLTGLTVKIKYIDNLVDTY